MSKKLFVLIGDGGDGSYNAQYTLNERWIAEQQEKYDNDEIEYGSLGVDGDGFHYDTILVPDDATLESLGVRWDCAR